MVTDPAVLKGARVDACPARALSEAMSQGGNTVWTGGASLHSLSMCPRVQLELTITRFTNAPHAPYRTAKPM
jgi:hypothetical protein